MPPVFIAPDGAVPNSIIEKEVLNWFTFKKKSIATPSQTMFKKKKKELKDKGGDDQVQRRLEYQDKLKEKMQQMLDEKTQDQNEIEVQDIPPVVEEQSQKLRVGTVVPPDSRTLTDFEPIPKPIVEYQVPETIERFMNYDWFPEDLVFYMPGNEPKSNDNEIVYKTSKGKLTKYPVI